jgi:phosphoribosyl-AMP cyclohydrolase
VHSVALDCDGDTLLVRVDQTGPACHTGAPTCFEDVLLADRRDASDDGPGVDTARIVADPKADPMEGTR